MSKEGYQTGYNHKWGTLQYCIHEYKLNRFNWHINFMLICLECNDPRSS